MEQSSNHQKPFVGNENQIDQLIIFLSFLPFGRNVGMTTGKRNQWDSSEYANKKNAAERQKKKPKWWAFNESLDIIYCRLHVGVIQEEQGIQNEKCQPLQDPQLVPFTIIQISTFHCPPLVCKNWLGFFFFLFQTTERQDRPCLLSFTILPILMQGRNLDHLAILKHSQTGEDNRIPIGIH